MRHVDTFIIAMYDVMNYSLLMPSLVAFYAQRNEIKKKLNFLLHWKSVTVYDIPYLFGYKTGVSPL